MITHKNINTVDKWLYNGYIDTILLFTLTERRRQNMPKSIDFDFEVELHYHPENFETDVRNDDFDECDDPHAALAELHSIERIEAETHYNFQ